jgi:hypothetical protein
MDHEGIMEEHKEHERNNKGTWGEPKGTLRGFEGNTEGTKGACYKHI